MKELKAMSNKYYLCGEAKVGKNTFNLDVQKEGSTYRYSSMNLYIDCGDCGSINATMQGGFKTDGSTTLYHHGEKQGDYGTTTDWNNRIDVKWNDRFNKEIIGKVSKQEFIAVEIEKDENGNPLTRMFLSEYDAVSYLASFLENGMKIVVSGDFRMEANPEDSTKPYMKRLIKRIRLATKDEKKTAHAKLGVLIDENSVLNTEPNEKGMIEVKSNFVGYVGKAGGVEVKGNICFPLTFNIETKNPCYTKWIDAWFKPSKGKANSITCEFEWRTALDSVQSVNVADYSDDIKMMIENGLMTEEEAQAEMVKGMPSAPQELFFLRPSLNMNRKFMFVMDDFDKEDLRYIDEFVVGTGAMADDKVSVAVNADEISSDDMEKLKDLGIDLSNLDSDESVSEFFSINSDDLPF